MLTVVMAEGSFVVLLPVKAPGSGKSRLAGLTDQQRGRLAAAFATDVVDACLTTPLVGAVLVISDDEVFAATLVARGAQSCGDPGAGLNAALRHGAAIARRSWPHHRPAALLADLPALRPDDLAEALGLVAASPRPSFVRDADATGTTLYSASYDAFDPRFGSASATAHADAGAQQVEGALASLRRDVDDLDGLAEVIRLGVGPATRRALADGPTIGT